MNIIRSLETTVQTKSTDIMNTGGQRSVENTDQTMNSKSSSIDVATNDKIKY